MGLNKISENRMRVVRETLGEQPPLYLREMVEIGPPDGAANLLGIQPYMLPRDYASKEAFHQKLSGYLQAAARRGWLHANTIAVFPEYIGTWLVALNERPGVYSAASVATAMRHLIAKHPLRFLWTLLHSPAQNRVKDALFRVKAPRMARVYQEVFSSLAVEFGMTIVAGSILLPSPQVAGQELRAGRGPLYNVSFLFHADGRIDPQMVKKAYPITAELPFTASEPCSRLPVFHTPAGRLGVLICADSWYPDTYATLKSKGAEMIVVPSYLAPDGAWNRLWPGYDGAPAPADVAMADVGQITEGEAWLKYALAGRMRSAGVQWGLNVFLRGKLWDLGADGRMVAVAGAQPFRSQEPDGAALLNLWLPGATR